VITALLVAALAWPATDPAPPRLFAERQPREVIAAIQVHGNKLTSDDEVRRLAAVTVGMPFDETTIDEVAARLRASRRFERVEVLKRFASIGDPTQILLVLIVDDGPVAVERTGDPANPVRVVRGRRRTLMVLPLLWAEDGYGAAYGAELAWPDAVGKNSRLAFPLTWGGEKRAAAELDAPVGRGPFDRLLAGVSLSRRTNPHFDRDDDRARVWLRGERAIGRALRLGATAGWQDVWFLDAQDRFAYGAADATLDTRVDPVLPRNAVYARAGWEHIAAANRVDLDARGYIGLFRQNVLALRVQRSDADRPLPPFAKPLLGGMANVRGFSAGTGAGDTLVAASGEVIVPLTSPIRVGRLGVSVFVDSGAAYDKDERLADQTWKTGIGGSVWFSAAFVRLNFAIAHGRGSSTRAHVGANVTF
jgi:surface antigen Omp85-like protein/surface antigen-like variable number repeat protein